MRIILAIGTAGLLSACTQVPNSAPGPGFDPAAAAQRDAALTTSQPIAPAGVVSQETLLPSASVPAPAPVGPSTTLASALGTGATGTPTATVAPVATSDADLAREAAAAIEATSSNSGVAPVQASPSNPPPQIVDNGTGLSDENDFSAVSARQSIESDAARIEANKQQYQQVTPTAVPDASAGSGVNIVSYALNTKHAPGTKVYTRVGINKAARAQRKCAGYPSADQAQIAFLETGGPRKDKLGLDPDGDGFACGWDPRTFRNAVRS